MKKAMKPKRGGYKCIGDVRTWGKGGDYGSSLRIKSTFWRGKREATSSKSNRGGN